MRGIYKENHPLAGYTTWKVGGCAERFYQPADIVDLAEFLKKLPKDEEVTWLGFGSNVLISDSGIGGTVICLRGRMNSVQRLGEFSLRAEAGASCAKLVKHCADLGMTDAAFLAGIPGTVGGALVLNAGAFGADIWSYVCNVETINRCGEIVLRDCEEFNPGYREIQCLHDNEWFVAGHLMFPRDENSDAVKNKIKECLRKRRETQPVFEFTCGSVFRNPKGDYAARLIESCGLKGTRIGGAVVSAKHANFIVNDGNAKAKDIEDLIDLVALRVFDKFGRKLVREVHMLGGKDAYVFQG